MQKVEDVREASVQKVDIDQLMFCKWRLEGLVKIIGSLADADVCPDLEIVHEVLIDTITTMKAALPNGENVE